MKSIIKSFSEHGTFVQPDTLEYILSKENPEKFTSFITKNLKEYPLVLTIDHIKNIERSAEIHEKTKPSENYLEKKELQSKVLSTMYHDELKSKHPSEEPELEYDDPDKEDQIDLPNEELQEMKPKIIEIRKLKGWKPESKEYESEIKIIKDVTGNSTCEGTTNDFAKLFVNRYGVLKKILQNQRREMANIIPINRIKKDDIKDVQLVGMVKDVRTTVNGHRLIELEDESGFVTAIALKNNRDAMSLANEVVFDEIIGIRGRLSKNGDLIIIQNIIFPDISIQNGGHKSEVPICAAFLADIHIGSKQFMEKEWRAFLRWI
ncbi:MAG: hypothetical protein JSW62_04145, partial [Thermoplasmatales archaeon]